MTRFIVCVNFCLLDICLGGGGINLLFSGFIIVFVFMFLFVDFDVFILFVFVFASFNRRSIFLTCCGCIVFFVVLSVFCLMCGNFLNIIVILFIVCLCILFL